MTHRPVNADDYLLLSTVGVAAVQKIKANPNCKHWFKYADLDQTIHYIMNSGDAYIVDETYLILVHSGAPWYSDVRILSELLVLALKPGGSFSSVVQALEAEAKRRSCKLVVSGTALAPSDRALTRMYNRYGYKQEAVSLIKNLQEI